ncbi:MAG: hypothetical protein JXA14_26675, partial [Anaerolineae bacterium]|nr:hypothetical protein [Anaerolineae bacterium]
GYRDVEGLGETAARLALAGYRDVEGLGETAVVSYVGNIKSKRFHLFSCRYAQRISLENYVSFVSKEEAVAQGYTPCEICEP